MGSYSDIADLWFVGCTGFNFGCGYHRQHHIDCYADLSEANEMVARFARFWHRNAGLRLYRQYDGVPASVGRDAGCCP